MKIALYHRHVAPADQAAYTTLCDMLHRRGFDTCEVGEGDPLPPCDYLFSIGGDGTLLSTMQFMQSYCPQEQFPPVLGINFGHLGFLTTVGKDDLEGTIEALTRGHFSVEERSLLTTSSLLALNEVFLHRTEETSFLRTEVYADDQFVATYSGDGVIVATPTGSTAYSLSCGGPILTPDSRCLSITPICPHTLTQRPLILPDSVRLSIRVEADCILGIDSRRIPLSSTGQLDVQLAPSRLRLVRIGEQNFFSAIREKLMWGTEYRQ